MCIRHISEFSFPRSLHYGVINVSLGVVDIRKRTTFHVILISCANSMFVFCYAYLVVTLSVFFVCV
jgi:hypothetical protein